ncbi:MAG: DAK2 domain-containing protein [Candidatus Desulforudis sp.]|nr:DAK2 domain-containing protein [Desulforudis sp.]
MQYLESAQLQEVLVAGAARLARLRKEIDRLNVFPVPDGDTGTNMYLTFMVALQELGEVTDESLGAVTGAVARGALRGARGNSGVILSQILQGFAVSLAGKERAGAQDIADALELGVDYAYRALSDPVEGTILTVARSAAEAARYAASRSSDLRRLSIYTYRKAVETLAITPELLPVLKKAGVVDAGGQGFLVILEGMLQVFRRFRQDELLTFPLDFERDELTAPRLGELDDIKFLYCTEFLVRGPGPETGDLREKLRDMGDCLMVVGNGETLKVHIHTNHPGTVLEIAVKQGTLHEVHINNMRDQHVEMQRPNKPLGVVSVVSGEGLTKIFESLGVDIIVDGRQTMNPSTEEILRAVERTPADRVLILPNNGNIILAAQQVQALSRKEIRVVPTHTVPQGLAAMLAFVPDADLDSNFAKMEVSRAVLTGEVTRAVRDAEIDGLQVTQGEFVGLAEDRLVQGETLAQVIENVIAALAFPGALVTLYHGKEVSTADAEELVTRFTAQFPDNDFELYYGGQPLYYFIISVE